MTDLITHMREVIEKHDMRNGHANEGPSCGCGAAHLSDHPRHVAQAIVDRLRHVSALLAQELTLLEGAE